MASEAKRGLVRIAANYARLFSNVLLGLVSVQLLVRHAGNEGWALISMLGATTGIANFTQESMQRSMIAELGAALHSDDSVRFRRVYNTALLFSAGVACFTALLFSGIYFLVPIFNIEPGLLSAARWLVAFKTLESFTDVLLSPAFNMYIVSERMLAFNAWTLCQRVARVGAALWLAFMLAPGASTALAVKHYALVGAVMYVGITLVAVLVMMLFVDRRTIPRPWLARREALRGLVQVSKWNMLMTTSQNLHLRADQVITNFFFGLTYNATFGWAVQLSSYVRMLTVGMTDGLDAASARISARKGEKSVRELLAHSTRLHAFVAVPAGIGMLVLAEPALRLWIARQMQEPEVMIPLTVVVMQVITLGLVIRSISDGWIRVLYGAGHIRSYARPIAYGSVFNPIIAIALSLLMPEGTRFLGPAISYTVVTLVLGGLVVPIVGAKCLGLRPRELVAPALRPTLMALIASPILLVASRLITEWNVLWLAFVCGLYGAVVTGLCLVFAVTPEERQRFGGAIVRTLRKSRTRPAGPEAPTLQREEAEPTPISTAK